MVRDRRRVARDPGAALKAEAKARLQASGAVKVVQVDHVVVTTAQLAKCSISPLLPQKKRCFRVQNTSQVHNKQNISAAPQRKILQRGKTGVS